jgi:hypothetical protein
MSAHRAKEFSAGNFVKADAGQSISGSSGSAIRDRTIPMFPERVVGVSHHGAVGMHGLTAILRNCQDSKGAALLGVIIRLSLLRNYAELKIDDPATT